jgi:hypothetical protein
VDEELGYCLHPLNVDGTLVAQRRMPPRESVEALDVIKEVIETQLAESFRHDVVRGLARQHKAIPCRSLYVEGGSALFEAIERVEESRPTRTEIGILTSRANELARFVGPCAGVIESDHDYCAGKANDDDSRRSAHPGQ